MENIKQKDDLCDTILLENSTILNEQTIKYFQISEESKNEIKQQDVKFYDELSKIASFCFPPTGIFSLMSAYKMKKYYFLKDYKKSIKYKNLSQIFSNLSILIFLFAIIYLILNFFGN